VKPARFGYHRAHSLAHAIDLLETLGDDARVIAGGQSLIPMMNFRLAQPSHLVDITRLPGLDRIERDGAALRLGALVTHLQVESSDRTGSLTGYRLLQETMRYIGHLPIRTRGTVGGSLAHADPTAEWCLLAVLLDAQIELTGPQGIRTLPAADFLLGHYTTAIGAAEVLTAVIFPAGAPHAALLEHAERAGDFATIAVAVSLDVDVTADIVTRGAIAVAGTGPVPMRIASAEALLANGSASDAELFDEVADAVARAIEPTAHGMGSATYRRELARTLTTRACRRARGTDDA
jgi:carbon-monoxide dehydrogenase medium subunit